MIKYHKETVFDKIKIRAELEKNILLWDFVIIVSEGATHHSNRHTHLSYSHLHTLIQLINYIPGVCSDVK
jgi:hypothetical protein